MHQGAAIGSFADDLPNVLAGLALMLAFVLLLSRRRVAEAAWLQGITAAVALAWQSAGRDDVTAWPLALIAVATLGAMLPLALRRLARRLPDAADPAPGWLAAVAGLAMVVLAILVVPPNAALAMRGDVAVALAVLLLGMLTMAVRRGTTARLGGFLSMLDGAVLAMAAGGSAIPATALGAALLALAALGATGLHLAGLR